MGVHFAVGDLAWNSADGVGTTYTVSGLAFRPKGLMFMINGLSSAVDAASEIDTARVGIGFATGTADRRCVGVTDVDAAGSADTQEIYRADAVLATVSAAAVVDGLLDLNAVNNDGFQLIVDDAAPVNLRVFWKAWGGDIVDQQTGEIAEPAATGVQSYTVGAGWQPNVALFAGCQLTAAAPTAAVADAGLMFGAATGTGDGNQFVCLVNSDEGSATMDTDHYAIGSECLAMITVAGGNPNARAQFNGFDSVGFDLNWVARGVTNRRYIYLAMRGGNWRAGEFTIFHDVTGRTATISGLGFRPTGLLMADCGDAEQVAGTSAPDAILDVGAAASLTSRHAMGYVSEDGTANAEVNLTIDYDAIIASPGSAGNVYFLVDVDAFLGDGFRVILDQAAVGSPTIWYGYLACGAVDVPLPLGKQRQRVLRRAA